MEISKTPIEGLLVLKPRLFKDNRGVFFESFNQQKFEEYIGKKIKFVQDNESVSKKHVLRGLHFQSPPMAQGKLVRVAAGSVIDVAVDLRKNSPTFGHWHSELLSAQNNTLFWIPEGFAHGFLSLEENTKFLYKCTNYYAPETENTVRWDDEQLSINWFGNEKIEKVQLIISEKDQLGIEISNFVSPF